MLPIGGQRQNPTRPHRRGFPGLLLVGEGRTVDLLSELGIESGEPLDLPGQAGQLLEAMLAQVRLFQCATEQTL